MTSLHLHLAPELEQDVRDLVLHWAPKTCTVGEINTLVEQITRQIMNVRLLSDKLEGGA